MQMLGHFIKTEEAQDLTEYALLLAFVCLVTSAIFVVAGGSFVAIWSTSNVLLTSGAAVASS
jgi:hypothetical protein